MDIEPRQAPARERRDKLARMADVNDLDAVLIGAARRLSDDELRSRSTRFDLKPKQRMQMDLCTLNEARSNTDASQTLAVRSILIRTDFFSRAGGPRPCVRIAQWN